MPSSRIEQATWYSLATAMHPTYWRPTHEPGGQEDIFSCPNGAILTISQIIKAVMSSVAEAKIGALYINCKEAIPARHTLEFLGHKQPPTPMQTDNTAALGVVNNNVMKKLKSMDMKYHWLSMPNKSTSIPPLLGGRKIKQR